MVSTEIQAQTVYKDVDPIAIGESTTLLAPVSTNSNTTITYTWTGGNPYVSLSRNGKQCTITGLSVGSTEVKCTLKCENSSSGTTYRYLVYYVTVIESSITGISLNYTSIDMLVGGIKQLSATVSPSDASQDVKWSVVSGSSVASVSLSGSVTAKAVGTAVIRATSKIDNSVYEDCIVTVTEPELCAGTWSGDNVTIISNAIIQSTLLPYGNYSNYTTTQLLYTPIEIGKSAPLGSIAFYVADPFSYSTSELKIYLGHKSGKFSNVSDYVTSSDLTLVYSGSPILGQNKGWETLQFNEGTFFYNGIDNLVVVITKAASSNSSDLWYRCYTGSDYVLYRRSDTYPEYSDISNTEKVYLKSLHRPVVRFTITPTSIELNQTYKDMEVGTSFQLTASVSPSAASQSVTWSVVSGSTCASVSSSGLVTAKAAGTATIRATSTANSSVYKDCTVSVTEPELESGTWSGNMLTIGDNSTNSSYGVPYNNYYYNSTAQMLYTPTEIGKGGEINSIAFKVASASACATSEVNIYLGHKSGTFKSTDDYVSSSNLKLVYSGSPTLGQSVGWETMIFNKGSFTYNGTDNLVVVVTKKSSKWTSTLKYNYYIGDGYTLFRQSDGDTNYGEVTNTSCKYSVSTSRPSVRFEFADSQVENTYKDGDIFTANTTEGVEMTFKVISAANRTCQVGSNTCSINSSTTGTITIPQIVNGYTVTSIAEDAFFSCTGLTSINIPNSVTDIGISAFSGCSSLTSITIPNSVIRISIGLFENCSNLTSITVDADNRVFDSRDNCNAIIETAGNTLISGCKNTIIPNSVTRIGGKAFSYCSSLTSIIIPNSVTSIEYKAFAGCSGLRSIILGNSVTDICDYAFDGCSGLTNITLPNSLTSIGTWAFNQCSSLMGITIPNSVEWIGDRAFCSCSSLTSITIPNSVTSIGDAAFYGCNGLTSVISLIENPFQLIKTVFKTSSYEQATLYVPAGTKSLYEALGGWNQFSNIVEMEPEDPTVFVAESTNGVPMTFKITDEDNKICQIGTGNGAAINTSTTGHVTLPVTVNGYSVTAIAANAFVGTGIGGVSIPNSIKSIGENAFKNCASLYEPESYIEEPFDIPESAFAGIPSSAILSILYGTKDKYLTASGWNVFSELYDDRAFVNGIHYSVNGAVPIEKGDPYTAWVESSEWNEYNGDVVIPEILTIGEESFTVVGIDDGAFAESQITSVTIPSSVRSIDDHAFYNCSALQSVTSYIMEPKNESDAFVNIPTGATLYVPNGTKSLYEALGGWDQFTNIEELEPEDPTVFVAESTNGIPMTFKITDEDTKTCQIGTGNGAAISASISDVIVLPQTTNGYAVTSIAANAFAGTGIGEVYIPKSIKNIGEKAFYGCARLGDVNSYIEEPFDIPESAFASIPSDVYFTILYGTKDKYLAAEGWSVFSRIYDDVAVVDGIRYSVNGAVPIEEEEDAYTAWVHRPSKWDKYEGDIVIPEILTIGEESFTVEGIDDGAFAKSQITSVTIPSTISYIDDRAFSNCQLLQSVTSYIMEPEDESDAFVNIPTGATLYVPNGTKSLYEAAGGWNQFTNIVEMEPDDPTVFVAESTNGVPMTFKITDEDAKTCQIGNSKNAAINSNTDNKIVIPKLVNGYTVTAIADNAFANCVGIYSVYIPNSIQSIGENAFNGCASLSSVDSYIEEPFDIPESAFANIANDASLDVIYGTKEKYQALTGWNVFNRIDAETAIVNGLRYSVDVPEENGAPYTAWVMSSKWKDYSGDVVIPEVFTIGDESFSVVGIADGAFAESQITSVTIPSSVRSIDGYAFYNCLALQSVTSYIMEPKNESDAFVNIPTSATLYVPAGTKSLYEAAGGWNRFTNIVEMEPDVWWDIISDGIYYSIDTSPKTEGLDVALYVTHSQEKNGYSGNIVIPTTVTNEGISYVVEGIGEGAFAEMENLTSVEIPNTVVYIGEEAFVECANLESVVIPNTVISIGENAFGDCEKLSAIHIPEHLAEISAKTFKWCKSLTTVEIPASVTSIGQRAFSNCDNLTSIISYISTPFAIDLSTFGIYDKDRNWIANPNTTLYVPLGTKALYMATEGWKEFANIMEMKKVGDLCFVIDNANELNNSIGEQVFTPDTEIAVVIADPENKDYSGDVVIPSFIEHNGKTYAVEAINSKAFKRAPITSVSFPTSLRLIGEQAFDGCEELSEVVIPEGVGYIFDTSFAGCTHLTTVTLPSTLINIGMDAFSESHGSITTINCNLTKPFGIDKWTFGSEDESCEDYWNPYVYENATLYVPYGTKELYAATEGWNLFQNIVEVGFEVTDISQMDNVLYVDDAEGIADGRMTFYVKMKNCVVAEGFNFNLYIPEGFSIAENLDGEPDAAIYTVGGRTNTSKTYLEKPYIDPNDGGLVIRAYSSNGATIDGNDGPVIRVRLLIAKGTPVGNYPLEIKKWGVIDNLGTRWPKGDRPTLRYPLSVVAKVRGDANGDASDVTKEAKDNVDVDAGDFVTINHYILGLPYEKLDMTAADANGDGVVNAADLTAISNLKRYGTISKPTTSSSRNAHVVEEIEAE